MSFMKASIRGGLADLQRPDVNGKSVGKKREKKKNKKSCRHLQLDNAIIGAYIQYFSAKLMC